MGPNTNTAHFSIMMGPAHHLDGHYTIFGTCCCLFLLFFDCVIECWSRAGRLHLQQRCRAAAGAL